MPLKKIFADFLKKSAPPVPSKRKQLQEIAQLLNSCGASDSKEINKWLGNLHKMSDADCNAIFNALKKNYVD